MSTHSSHKRIHENAFCLADLESRRAPSRRPRKATDVELEASPLDSAVNELISELMQAARSKRRSA